MPDLDLIVNELRAAAKDGVSCIVDAAASGRRSQQQIDHLKTLATRSGLHIVVAGGYYKAPYPAGVMEKSDEQLVNELVQDAQTQRWGALGEIGTSLEGVHPHERRMLKAVAQGQSRTGLSIFTHSPHEGCPKCALEQLDILESAGVNPRHLCIGHLTDIPATQDPGWQAHKAIAKRGAFLGFDTIGNDWTTRADRTPPWPVIPDGERVKMVLSVLDAGFEDQVLFGTDFNDVRQLKANWGSGLSTVLLDFVPKLRYAGVKEATIHKILVDNPLRFLAFVPKQTVVS
jgi:phosphotriesterase-related protein